MIETINYWILDKNDTFSGHLFLHEYYDGNGYGRHCNPSFLEVLGHVLQIEKLTHQPKEFVNQKSDINEWERRGLFLIIFNTPVLPVDTTKIN